MYLLYNWIQTETHIFYLLALCQHILSDRRKYSPILGQQHTDNQSLNFKPLHSFSANCTRGWNVLPLFVLSMWQLFLLCNFNENKKVLKFAFIFAFLNPYPLRDVFSHVLWQLNDRPKVIPRQDLERASVKTLRWDSGAGTISGETAKRSFYYGTFS